MPLQADLRAHVRFFNNPVPFEARGSFSSASAFFLHELPASVRSGRLSERISLYCPAGRLSPEGRRQVRLAGPGLSDQDDALPVHDVFASHQLVHQHLVQVPVEP